MSTAMLTVLSVLLLLIACNASQTTNQPSAEKLKTVRLHIYGFSKSKSGAV